MAHALKIALIADIHHGMDVGTKVGSAALTLLQPFVDWVNAIGPDIVVELGDRINDHDKDTDLKWTRDVAHAFTAIERPCVHILGNHDAAELSRTESEAVIVAQYPHRPRWWNIALPAQPPPLPVRFRFTISGVTAPSVDVVVTPQQGKSMEVAGNVPAQVTFHCDAHTFVLIAYGRCRPASALSTGALTYVGSQAWAEIFLGAYIGG